jgi:hypothetical protein
MDHAKHSFELSYSGATQRTGYTNPKVSAELEASKPALQVVNNP